MDKDTGQSRRRSPIVGIHEEQIHDHLGELVRGTVEQTLNELLEAEAESLCNAARYERTDTRRDYRSDTYSRELDTKAGRVKLKMPKLRRLPFEVASIERYKRRETSVKSLCGSRRNLPTFDDQASGSAKSSQPIALLSLKLRRTTRLLHSGDRDRPSREPARLEAISKDRKLQRFTKVD
ncbi:MAG: transposase [Acidobacteriota bacterium]|nr:transposase [Acidobacteriota bacterium]